MEEAGKRRDEEGLVVAEKLVAGLPLEWVQHHVHQPGPLWRGSCGETFLFYAAKRGFDVPDSPAICSFLVKELGLDVDHKTERMSQTALYFAATEEVADSLIQLEADVNVEDVNRQTPLFYAARNGRTDLLGLLLRRRACPFHRDLNGQSALFYAARASTAARACVELLLHAASEIEGDTIDSRCKFAESRDLRSRTALFFAARHGVLDGCLALVDAAEDACSAVEAVCDDGQTPIFHAAVGGHVDCVEALLVARASPDHQDHSRRTPLAYATMGRHLSVARVLVAAAADPSVVTMTEASALWAAAATPYLSSRARSARGAAKTKNGSKKPVTTLSRALCAEPGDSAGNAAEWASLLGIEGMSKRAHLGLGLRRSPITRRRAVAATLATLPSPSPSIGASSSTANLVGGSPSKRGRRSGADGLPTSTREKARHQDTSYSLGASTPPCLETPPIEVELFVLAERGGSEELRSLLERRADASARDNLGRTALFLVAARDDRDGVSFLLAAQSPPDATDLAGRTPLLSAARSGAEDAARVLLESRASVNKADYAGRPALFYAILESRASMARLLIDSYGAWWPDEKVVPIDWDELCCRSIFDLARDRGLSELLGRLGVAVQRWRDHEDKRTSKCDAAREDSLRLQLWQCVREIRGTEGFCALEESLAQGQIHGAPMSRLYDAAGETALFQAARAGEVPCLELLLTHGFSIAHRCALRETPLFAASRASSVASVKRLLDATAEVNALNALGRSVLFEVGDAACATLLVEHRCDIDTRSRISETALFAHASVPRPAVLAVLLDARADAAMECRQGRTPLHAACGGEVVECLVRAGVPVEARDELSRTPLFHAASRGDARAVAALLAADADANAIDAIGQSPLFHAAAAVAASATPSLTFDDGAAISSAHLVVDLLLHARADPSLEDHRGDVAAIEPRPCAALGRSRHASGPPKRMTFAAASARTQVRKKPQAASRQGRVSKIHSTDLVSAVYKEPSFGDWLQQHGLGRYEALLVREFAQSASGKLPGSLTRLSKDDLDASMQAAGVELPGHRAKLRHAIDELRSQSEPSDDILCITIA